MPLVVGVSFKKAGKVYYFDPSELKLNEGDCVIAETSRGIEFGEVMIEPKDVPDEEIVPPLRKIVRKATEADYRKEDNNRHKERQALEVCLEKVHYHNLPMKLIDAEYCFDGSQVTLYFSAESRVDFRELVKDLAVALRTKVQLHQVGVRDEAKLFGGMGPCGRMLCCSTFLNDFEPVSMKMAKEQSLFLNPLKFSGLCGKLMCCLKYEYSHYREAKSNLPEVGALVKTAKGEGRVVEVNAIKYCFYIEVGENLIEECTQEDIIAEGAQCPMAQNGCGNCRQDSEEIQQAVPVIEPAPIPEPPTPKQPAEESKPPAATEEKAGNLEQNKDGAKKRKNRGGRRGRRRN